MTKADLVERIAAEATLSKSEAELVINTVLESIVESLKRGEKIELRGFGSFRTRVRRQRQGRNPKTGTRVDVPGKAVSYFKPGKELRELLNPGEADTARDADGAPDALRVKGLGAGDALHGDAGDSGP